MSKATRYFVLRGGGSYPLTIEEILTIVAIGTDGLLLVCDTVLDTSGQLRDISEHEKGLLTKATTMVRITSNDDHKELKSGEVFLGNYNEIEVDSSGCIGWKSKRVGEKSYGPNGTPLSGLWPVFATKQEIFFPLQK